MIYLLENKYKRKIRVGASNIMDNLNDALKDKKVHLRSKRLKCNWWMLFISFFFIDLYILLIKI